MTSRWRHPVRLIPLVFLVVIVIGTLLLLLPVSRTADAGASLRVATFTSVSATCVTGLTVVDTATYWSPFGQTVIMGLMQAGGFGVMSTATLLVLLVFGRVGVHGSLAAQTGSRTSGLGNVRGALTTIALATAAIEGVITLVLAARFFFGLGEPLPTALWHGLFQAVSAFNNAGFTLYSDSLMGFVGDPWVIVPTCAAIIAGGIGFPVYYELIRRRSRPRQWSVHARLTVIGYVALTAVSTLSFALVEWNNRGTLGGLSLQDKLLGTLLGGVTPRTAGFNSVDYAQVEPETVLLDTIMMFIGGGSAGTAGGIKVGTFLILAFVIWAEVRGEPQVVIGRRAIPESTIREALSVALLGVAVVVAGAAFLLADSDQSLERVVFEAASAFGSGGLSAGITASFNTYGQVVLMVLMFVGRLGPITAAAALALAHRRRSYRLAEERPLVG